MKKLKKIPKVPSYGASTEVGAQPWAHQVAFLYIVRAQLCEVLPQPFASSDALCRLRGWGTAARLTATCN